MYTDLVRGRLALAVAALIAGLLAAGCGATPTPSPSAPSPTASPVETLPPTATPAPATATATPALTALPSPTSVPTSGATPPPYACSQAVARPGTVPTARISSLTLVNDAGTGRITFTFKPSGNVAAVPEIEVRPVKPPFTRDPSGLPLDVAGAQFVQIVLKGGTALDADMNPTFAGPFDFTTGGKPIVEMKRAGDFEAVSTFVVGVGGVPCVRILPPDGQSHLVIEIQARTAG